MGTPLTISSTREVRLDGLIPATVLPMTADGAIDETGLRRYLRWIAAQGPAAVAVNAALLNLTKALADGRVVVLEYEVDGTILATRVKYNNRFCSIIKIENRKIAYWRDYMDSLAAWNALSAQAH